MVFFLSRWVPLAAITDLVSWVAGKGPSGQIYFQNSIAISGFEAHCLAIIAGFILLLQRKSPDAAFFNKAGIAIHGMLGISNITRFQIFLDTNTLPMGYLTTLIHFTFVLLHIIAIRQKNQRRYQPVQIDRELK